MEATLTIDGRTTPLSAHEAKLCLKAVGTYRAGIKKQRPSVQQVFDLEVYDFKRQGYSDAEIARTMGVTARRVKSAIERVEGGRYGRSFLR